MVIISSADEQMIIDFLASELYNELKVSAENIPIVGPKTLILDAVTTQILTQVNTQNELLADEFVSTILIEKLHTLPPSNFVSGVTFLQPTESNLKILAAELEKRKLFKYVHLNFSSELSQLQVADLAQHDKFAIVASVRSLDFDFLPVTSNLVSCPSNTALYSLLRSLNGQVKVAYEKTEECQSFADTIKSEKFDSTSSRDVQLLIIDRKFDEVSFVEPPTAFGGVVDVEFNRPFETGKLYTNKYIEFSNFTLEPESQRFLPLDYMNSISRIPVLARKVQKALNQNISDNEQEMVQQLQQEQRYKPLLNELNAFDSIIGQFKATHDFRLREARIFSISNGLRDAEVCSSEIKKMLNLVELIEKKEEKDKIVQQECQNALALALSCGQLSGVKDALVSYIQALANICEESYCEKAINTIKSAKNVDLVALDVRKQAEIARHNIDLAQHDRPDFIAYLEDQDCLERAKAGYYLYRSGIVCLAEISQNGTFPQELFEGEFCPKGSLTVIYVIGGATVQEAMSLMSYEYYARYNEGQKGTEEHEIHRLICENVILCGDKVANRNEYLGGLIESSLPRDASVEVKE